MGFNMERKAWEAISQAALVELAFLTSSHFVSLPSPHITLNNSLTFSYPHI